MQDKLLNLIKQYTPNLKRVQMDLSLENEQLKLAQDIVKLFALPDAKKELFLEEYHKFHKWMENEGWYEAADMEYDNSNDPNSCIRLNIKELYIEYKRKQ